MNLRSASLCLLFSSMYCGINIFESSHCRIEVINTRHFDRPCPNTLPFPLALTSTVFQLNNHFFTRHRDPLLRNSRSLRFTKRLWTWVQRGRRWRISIRSWEGEDAWIKQCSNEVRKVLIDRYHLSSLVSFRDESFLCVSVSNIFLAICYFRYPPSILSST